MLQQEILEASFGVQTSIYNFHISERLAKTSNVRPVFRTFDRNFERPAGMSNVWPEFRTSGQKFARSTGDSNVPPEIRTLDEKFERSPRNLNVLPESRTFGPIWARTHMGPGPQQPAGIPNVQPESQKRDLRPPIVQTTGPTGRTNAPVPGTCLYMYTHINTYLRPTGRPPASPSFL